MFNFLKSRMGGMRPVVETQRQTFERAFAEVNDIVVLMVPKPKVTIDSATGTVAFELPDQMLDEALALPAPSPEEVAGDTAEAK